MSDMFSGDMFSGNSISDLTPLAHWNVSKATDMSKMFYGNSISDLTPLAHWDISNVTNMSGMFLYNRNISDLAPLAKWDVSNVTDMSNMFHGNKIGDLSPLAKWDVSNVTDMRAMFSNNKISNLTPLAKWDVSNVTDMSGERSGMGMFSYNSISDLTPLAHWKTGKVTDMSWMFSYNSISDLTPLANWDVSKVIDMNHMFAQNPDIKDLKPIANRDLRSVAIMNLDGIFEGDTQLDLTDINNTQFMQDFLKIKEKYTSDTYTSALRRILGNVLQGTTFITNNADLVDVIVGQKLPVFTNTAKRTIVFNFPDGTSKTITQHIYYKTIAPVQIEWLASTGGRSSYIMMAFNPNPVQSAGPRIIKTYTIKDVKASDWQLDTSQHNDAIIVNGQIRFASVKIPHVNGYKAYIIVPNKLDPALFTVSFMAVPTENKPSTPAEETPSKPSAPTDHPNNSAWTMPADNSTYKVEVPTDDAIIDLSDLVIAEPVHARTRTQIRVNKRFKLSKKHSIKRLKHRKKAVRTFKKYRL